jgi:hypothetical protein
MQRQAAAVGARLCSRAGLLPVLECYRYPVEGMLGYLAERMAVPPLDRIADAFVNHGALDPGVRALSAYDEFLAILDDSEKLSELSELGLAENHLDDETVKREMASFHERVNIRGERIALPVGGPLEEAAWMKERIARAKQALPNGYCGFRLCRAARIRTRA